MKWTKHVLFVVFLTTSLFGFAQSTHSVEDTALVNDLLKKGQAIGNDDPVKAMAILQRALQISRNLEYVKGEAYALKNIGIVYYYQGKYIETLNYWNESLALFERQKDDIGIANILNNMGAIYFDQGDDVKALEYCLNSLQIAEKTGDKKRIMSALSSIGSIYYNKKDARALGYLLKALPLCEALNDTADFVVIAGNIGEIYFDEGRDIQALEFYNKAIKADANSASTAFAYNGIGKIYLRKGNYDMALKNHYQALAISGKLNDKLHRMRSFRGIGNVYAQKSYNAVALNFYRKAQSIGEEIRANVELKDVYSDMANAYSKDGDYSNAFLYKTKYADIKDTLYNVETSKKLGKLQFDFDLLKKQGEINLLTKDKKLSEVQIQRQRFARNTLAIGLFLLLICAFILYRNYRRNLRINKTLDKQKDEIEDLLLNILPSEVAKELQTTGQATPRHYESVSVMFTDFEGFTAIADKLTPGELVEELNTCFMAFDSIIDKYGLEKIKTIGDSYMCAGGIPAGDADHVYKIVKAGLEIQDFVRNYNEHCKVLGRECWGIRVGIHVGSLVAGVVGRKKYAYDIWGNTVNIASRMESNGIIERVNISHKAYELIKDRFVCSYRGKIHAKNVGEIDMYFVEHEINPAYTSVVTVISEPESSVSV